MKSKGICARLPSTAQAPCGAAFRRGPLGKAARQPAPEVHALSRRPSNTTSAEGIPTLIAH